MSSAKKLREHESKLAEILQTKNESNTEYYKEHDGIMQSLESFRIRFTEYKEELFSFTERAMGSLVLINLLRPYV